MRETSSRSGKFMPQISRDKRGINNKTYKKELASKTKKHKTVVTCTPRVTHDDRWISREPSHLAEPVTPSLVGNHSNQLS